MDDPRLSRMYARVLSGRVQRMRQRGRRSLERHHGRLVIAALLLTLLALGAGYVAHLHGRFRRLKTELKARQEPEQPLPPMPGGQEAVILSRTARGDGAMPEFVSATVLPGRGMSVLQITALLPGRGEVALLASPGLEAATAAMSGKDQDANGAATLELGGPVEVPWAGSILGPLAPNREQVQTDWRGRSLLVPTTGMADHLGVSTGGLLLQAGAASLSRDVMPDGGSVQATFEPESLGKGWPSQVEVTTAVLLSGRAFELRVRAQNVGREPTPIGIGWMPKLVIPSGDRRSALLRLPAEAREQMVDGRATGELVPVHGTPLDFTDRAGRRLGSAEIHDTFVRLRSGFLENGPIVELRDPGSGIGLRMTALSPQIRAVRVQAKAEESVVSVGFQTNYDDPLRHVWGEGDSTGLLTLLPGQTAQWRVRLELMTLSQTELPPL